MHRDLKPSNVLIGGPASAPEVKVIDFGIARELYAADTRDATLAGELLGTPEFMAPEQATGRGEVDVRADVFGLGALLYWALTGTPPARRRQDESLPAHLARVEQLDPERPSVRVGLTASEAADHAPIPAPLLRGDLDAIVVRSIARAPVDRYASVAEFRDDLRRWEQREPVTARRLTAGYELRRLYARRRRLIHSIAVAGTLIASLIGVLLWSIAETRATKLAAAESERIAALNAAASAHARGRSADATARLAGVGDDFPAGLLRSVAHRGIVDARSLCTRGLISVARSPDGVGAAIDLAQRLWVGPIDDLSAWRAVSELSGGARSLRFVSNDLLAIGTRDGRIIAVDPSTGDEHWRNTVAPTGRVVVAYSPAADHVVASTGDEVVWLDVMSGDIHASHRIPPRAKGNPRALLAAGVLGDGLTVVLAFEDRILSMSLSGDATVLAAAIDIKSLISASDGFVVQRADGRLGRLRVLNCMATLEWDKDDGVVDGTLLASAGGYSLFASDSGSLSIRSEARQQSLAVLSAHNGVVRDVIVEATGTGQLAGLSAGSDGRLVRWSVDIRTPVRLVRDGAIMPSSMESRLGKTVVLGSRGEPIAELPVPFDNVITASIKRASDRLTIAATDPPRVETYALDGRASSQALWSRPADAPWIRAAGLCEGSSSVYVPTSRGFIKHDLESGATIDELDVGSPILAWLFDDSSGVVVLGTFDHRLFKIGGSDDPRAILDLEDRVVSAVAASRGATLAVTSDGAFHRLDSQLEPMREPLHLADAATSIAVADLGRYAVVGGATGLVHVIDLDHWIYQYSVSVVDAPITGLAWDEAERALWIGTDSGPLVHLPIVGRDRDQSR